MFHFHDYKLIFNTTKHKYYECSRCGRRKVKVVFSSGYQPIDNKWLKKGDNEMSIYRKRSVEKIKSEIEYVSHQIDKAMDKLEKLENKMNYLRSELEFNKK